MGSLAHVGRSRAMHFPNMMGAVVDCGHSGPKSSKILNPFPRPQCGDKLGQNLCSKKAEIALELGHFDRNKIAKIR